MKTTQEIIKITKIENEIIYLNDQTIVKIFKVEPLNFSLKSEKDKQIIIENYYLFLKGCDFNFQLIIKSKKNNMESYIKNIQKYEINSELYREYIKFIKSFLMHKNFEIKEFFIIIKEKYDLENLIYSIEKLGKQKVFILSEIKKCENLIFEVTNFRKEDIIKIISCLINEKENYYNYEDIF